MMADRQAADELVTVTTLIVCYVKYKPVPVLEPFCPTYALKYLTTARLLDALPFMLVYCKQLCSE